MGTGTIVYWHYKQKCNGHLLACQLVPEVVQSYMKAQIRATNLESPCNCLPSLQNVASFTWTPSSLHAGWRCCNWRCQLSKAIRCICWLGWCHWLVTCQPDQPWAHHKRGQGFAREGQDQGAPISCVYVREWVRAFNKCGKLMRAYYWPLFFFSNVAVDFVGSPNASRAGQL